MLMSIEITQTSTKQVSWKIVKKWLTEDQFNKTMICKDPGMIQNVMDKYKMKKDYRSKLELQLNTLNK
jgi:NAD(P)H-flavin reductase